MKDAAGIYNMRDMVTVIIPAYNAERYIENAVDSVLAQSVRAAIIVVDDCSTDDTAERLKKYMSDDRVTYIKNEHNLGVAESRNRGIRLAGTKYIAFLDADDWWSSDKLEKQLDVLEDAAGEKRAVMCCTGRELMSSEGEPLGIYIGAPREITYNMILKTNSIVCSSVVVETEVAKEFYMTHSELHEDYILWLNILKKYEVCLGLDEPLVKSRMSGGGKSRNKFKSARMQWGVYRLIGFGVFKSVYYMINYMINGVWKYRKGILK